MVIRKVRGMVAGVTKPNWKNQSRGLTIGREIEEFKRVFKDNFVTLIVSAFGVVAALSWNEAIKEVVLGLFPTKGPLFAKLYSAVAITIIAIVVTYLLSKLKTEK
ncbi:MAG: DUF5654 family protein [Candidatus Aenigmatarchaeota archaeon]